MVFYLKGILPHQDALSSLEEPCLVPGCWTILETEALRDPASGLKNPDEDLSSLIDRSGDTETPEGRAA